MTSFPLDTAQASTGSRAHCGVARDAEPPSGISAYRVILHQSRLAQVEDWFVDPGSPVRPTYDPGCQLVLTYLGICTFSSGEDTRLIDANRALLAPPGWRAFGVSDKCASGFAAVLVRPSRELLEQIPGAPGWEELSGSAARSAPSTMRLRLLTQQLLRLDNGINPLQRDECVIHVMVEATGHRWQRAVGCAKAVERAKELLHARAGERCQLDEIATEIGLSPVYLTQEFTRCEGVPLYRYQMQLRLTRALLELPQCEDITGLALDLGFSSHSHFTSAFRKAFGTTPSAYRLSIGVRHLRFGEDALDQTSQRAA